MRKDEIVSELLRSAEENGLLPTLQSVFGYDIRVSVSFSERECETALEVLDFSVRASNALKRANVFNVGQVIDMIESEQLTRIRNLGKRTESEIKTRILVFGYEHLTDAEKRAFFYDLVERNAR